MLDLEAHDWHYVMPLDLETTRAFQTLLLALQRDEISEIELYSHNMIFRNPIRILIKKPTHSPASLLVTNSTIVRGLLTYIIDEDALEYWIEKIFEPYILSNGRAHIFDDNWQIDAYGPVKNDPSETRFKPIVARIFFRLKEYLEPQARPQPPRR